MQDPFCPYCGEPMRLDADSCHIWMKCDNCLSSSPKVDRPDKSEVTPSVINWFLYWSKCKEAACRAIQNHQSKKRPINKPLTKVEIFQFIATGEYFVAYYEEIEVSGTCAALWSGKKGIDETGGTFETDKLLWNDYGRTWRAWAARPTDEERAAAQWEE